MDRFIVMAFYEGHTLKQKLDESALMIDEALDVATQVAEGLVVRFHLAA